MKNCIQSDKILAQPIRCNYKDRREARIVRIVVPNIRKIVGRYFIDSGIGFVVPDDRRLNFDILIPPEKVMGARMGFIVIVELIQRPTQYTKAIGKIVKVLGDTMGTGIAVEMALCNHEIPYIWPKEVEKQIKGLKEEVQEAEKIGRVDLRKLPMITIDSKESHDFDDAVYCESKRSGGWRLWVAVADVSYYVRPNTPLDNEARKRGTSIYFPSQVIPMLPEVLSNGLCSLNPRMDRLCVVCEMNISSKGHLTSYKFYEAVIKSHACLTYTKVWNILQGDHGLREEYPTLIIHIEELFSLFKVLEQAREDRGGLCFESEEAKFIFNTECRIERIEPIQRNEVHKMIEECMILANISAARFVENAKEPALFRIHEKPTNEAITTFRSVLNEIGLKLPGRSNLKSRDYAKLLKSISNRPDSVMLQTMLLRSMKQAIYHPENHGHFGLSLQSYAHFTSPIRRYPDLSLHRAIKLIIAQHKKKERLQNISSTTTDMGGFHYSIEELCQIGQHCSMTERRADEATREVFNRLKCDFMLDRVGDIFKGIIANVTFFGLFVRLKELFIDGLVHISNLENDYYHFDQAKQCLIGESSGKIYCMGDRVKVRLIDVNIDERKIDFALTSIESLPFHSRQATYHKILSTIKYKRNKNMNKYGKQD